jgi:hypothetical protein
MVARIQTLKSPPSKQAAAELIVQFGVPGGILTLVLRRESGRPNSNCKKPQERGRTGWRSKSGKKQLNVS